MLIGMTTKQPPRPDDDARTAAARNRPTVRSHATDGVPPPPATREEARGNLRRARRMHQEPTFSGAVGTLVMAGVVVAVVAGIALGVARPGQSVQVVEGGGAIIPPEQLDSGFVGLLIATALSAVAGGGLGIAAWSRHVRWRGVGMLVCAGIVAAVTSLGIGTVGDVVGLIRQGDIAAASPGDVVTLIPPIPQLVPALLAAFLAMTAYWCGLLVNPDAAAGERGRSGEGAEPSGEPAGD